MERWGDSPCATGLHRPASFSAKTTPDSLKSGSGTPDRSLAWAHWAQTRLRFPGRPGEWGEGSWWWLLCAEIVGSCSYSKAGLAQGHLVLDVVPTGAHTSPGRVRSDTAEEQGVRLEHAVFGAGVVGREHQGATRMLHCFAINSIAKGKKRAIISQLKVKLKLPGKLFLIKV